MKWRKREVDKNKVRSLCEKYGVDIITASVMARRGIEEDNKAWSFIEDNTRYLHNPFLFDDMEDAVERILDAAECETDEGGEGKEKQKVLVYGDRDVDGVSASIIMTNALKAIGCNVSCRVPEGDEPYGLKAAIVEDFAKEGGSLIVTVDCGISCIESAALASEYGIDIIVTDHHNPRDILPDVVSIIDPKVKESHYPFDGLSGAGVALKVSYALRFAQLPYYREEIVLLDVHNEGDKTIAECIRTRNLVITSRMTEEVKSGASIIDTRLYRYLTGQHIFVWDIRRVKERLEAVFGRGVEFALTDIREEIGKKWSVFARKSLEEVRSASRLSMYTQPYLAVDALYNIFYTFVLAMLSSSYKDEADDISLVALSAMADIMPMTDENRIIVKTAMRTIQGGKVRRGIAELMAYLAVIPSSMTAKDMSWTVIPALNACGRMGKPSSALTLLSSEDSVERENVAKDIVAMNEERKRLVRVALSALSHKAEESLEENGGKMIAVIDGRIAKGVTGLAAARLVEQYEVPIIIGTKAQGIVTGSIRSKPPFSCTDFLTRFTDFFIDYGGHNSAAGFSFEESKIDNFYALVKQFLQDISIVKDEDEAEIDAEIPMQYLPSLMKTVDFFSPFGTGNKELLFLTKSLPVVNALVVGKGERQHLKLTLDTGGVKFPAMIWGGGELFKKAINIGDVINILYTMEKNTFNGMTTPQIIIKNWEKC